MLTELQKRIKNGKTILISEIKPPRNGDPETLKNIAYEYAGKVCALGLSDNRDDISMSAMAASSIVAQAGIEPIMHMITRDKNRIALVSDFLGAQALGINNVLLTSGTHQSLGANKTVKNVFDIDSIQLITTIAGLSKDENILGPGKIKGINSVCIGAAADPFADPIELQIMKLAKKIDAGAEFVITKPVFSVEGFKVWWEKVCAKGLQEKAAIIAGIKICTGSDVMKKLAESRPDPKIPEVLLSKMSSLTGKSEMREQGIRIALDIIKELSLLKGLRGFEINCEEDPDAVIDVINQSALAENGLEN